MQSANAVNTVFFMSKFLIAAKLHIFPFFGGYLRVFYRFS